MATSRLTAGKTLVLSGSTLDLSASSAALDNEGTIQVSGSSMLKLAASAGTNGTIALESNATLEVTAMENETIVFAAAAGTLRIDQPTMFTANISASSGNSLTTADVLDVIGVNAGTTTASTGAGSYNTSNGITTLTVHDTTGNKSYVFHLLGDYSASTWTVTNDGHGGADIVDPAATADTGNESQPSKQVAVSAVALPSGEGASAAEAPSIIADPSGAHETSRLAGAWHFRSRAGYFGDDRRRRAIMRSVLPRSRRPSQAPPVRACPI